MLRSRSLRGNLLAGQRQPRSFRLLIINHVLLSFDPLALATFRFVIMGVSRTSFPLFSLPRRRSAHSMLMTLPFSPPRVPD